MSTERILKITNETPLILIKSILGTNTIVWAEGVRVANICVLTPFLNSIRVRY